MYTWGIQASKYKWGLNSNEIFTYLSRTNYRCFWTRYTKHAWHSCMSNFNSLYLSRHHRHYEHVTSIQSPLRNMIGQAVTTHDWVKQQLISMERAFAQPQLLIWRHLDTFRITDYICVTSAPASQIMRRSRLTWTGRSCGVQWVYHWSL